MTSSILLTGFGPFGPHAHNPTEALVERIGRLGAAGMRAEVLPVTFEGGAARMRALIAAHRPQLVLATGMDAGASRLRVERIAVNERSGVDSSGVEGAGRQLEEAGPDGLMSTIGTRELLQRLRAAGLEAEESWHAGTFVCNAVLYAALRSGAPRAGFLHVPAGQDPDRLAEVLAALLPALARAPHGRPAPQDRAPLSASADQQPIVVLPPHRAR